MPFVVKFEHRQATLYLLASPLHDSDVVCVGTKRIIFARREKTDKRYMYKTQTIDVSPTPGDKDRTELKMYYTTWTTRNACLSSSYRCTIVVHQSRTSYVFIYTCYRRDIRQMLQEKRPPENIKRCDGTSWIVQGLKSYRFSISWLFALWKQLPYEQQRWQQLLTNVLYLIEK